MKDKQSPFAAHNPLSDGQEEVISRDLFRKRLRPRRHSRSGGLYFLVYLKHHKRKSGLAFQFCLSNQTKGF